MVHFSAEQSVSRLGPASNWISHTGPSHSTKGGNPLPPEVEEELSSIATAPAFARAPVMVNLLRYLTTESVFGRGDGLKSYTVAIDGLGKSDDFDAQIDSYPRVQVSRLRRMLDAHYREHGSASGIKLCIPKGGYRVDFEAFLKDTSAGRLTQMQLTGPAKIWSKLAVFLTIFAIAGLLLLQLRTSTENDGMVTSAWQDLNFPNVRVLRLKALDSSPELAIAAADYQNALREELSRYGAVAVSSGAAGNADYEIGGSFRSVSGGTLISMSLLEVHSGQIVWQRSAVRMPSGARLFDYDDAARETSAVLAQPLGIIHSDLRSRGVPIETPYGCWLAYTLYLNHPVGRDAETVRNCTDQWVQFSPNSAQAHAGKALIALEGATTATDAERMKLLHMAKLEAVQAVELNPNAPAALYAMMHASLLRGEYREMQNAANRIMLINPANPELAALVGHHKLFVGDLSGEKTLRDAIAMHANPPRRYFAGLFFAAVMREDPPSALIAARQLQSLSPTATDLGLLAIAEARNDQLSDARRHWQRAVLQDPRLGKQPALLLTPFPISRDVKARAMPWIEWLGELGTPR